jgi:hypothetical protein
LNAGLLYEVKLKISEDKFLDIKIAKKPLLEDAGSEESDSQKFVDEDNEYDLELVAYKENVGE